MRHLVAASFVLFACGFIQPALAQNEERGVPIEKAPYHLPVFRNEYVTLLNIYVPPQRNTGYHTHMGDSVSVNIEDADDESRPLAAAAGPGAAVAAGASDVYRLQQAAAAEA